MGIDKGILSAIADHRTKIRGPHFIISAERPLHPQNDEFRMNHDQLLSTLYNAGYDAHELKSNYGKPQHSIIIYGVDEKTANELHQLARKMGQGHSIYSDGVAHEMRFHQGASDGKAHYGDETEYHDTNSSPGGCHTLPGGMHHFDHKFDYGSLHLAGQLNKWGKRGA